MPAFASILILGDVNGDAAAGTNTFTLDLIPLVLVLLIGLMLWLVGRRVLRPAFAAAGLLFGGLVGWIAGEVFAGSQIMLWILAGVGGAVFCLAAVAAYRLAVAVGLGLTLGVLAPLAVWSGAELGLLPVEPPADEQGDRTADTTSDPESPESPDEPPDPAEDPDAEPGIPEDWEHLPGPVRDWLDDLLRAGRDLDPSQLPLDELKDLDPDDPDDLERLREMQDSGEFEGLDLLTGDAAREHFQRAEDAARQVLGRLDDVWQTIPPHLRPTLLLTGVVAALLGFLVGVVAATFAASAVTAMGGAMICLISAQVLLERFGVDPQPWLPASAPAWMGWWLVTSLIGVIVQWTTTPDQTDRNRDS